MSELKAFTFGLGQKLKDGSPCVVAFDDEKNPRLASDEKFYIKSEADKVIADLEESHKMEVEQLLMEIVGLKADYKEACDRLQTVCLIKDEQRVKADKLLYCLKYLVMRDLIKDCPAKKTATEIVKEYYNGLG